MRKGITQNCPARSKSIPVLLIAALKTYFVIDNLIHYKTLKKKKTQTTGKKKNRKTMGLSH